MEKQVQKSLESLKGKKLGNVKSVYAGRMAAAGPCGGNGTESSPDELQTLTLLGGGQGSWDGCD
ncbi:MAG: hypothetical protein LBE36_12340 [Flavobacteriaceae bacterium]|jgi:hypothetical protein|nr:hypothetical protein [Flavobacteriaceae bacterium]